MTFKFNDFVMYIYIYINVLPIPSSPSPALTCLLLLPFISLSPFLPPSLPLRSLPPLSLFFPQITDAIMNRLTTSTLSKDMDRWIEKRDQLSRRADELRRQKEALTKDPTAVSGTTLHVYIVCGPLGGETL